MNRLHFLQWLIQVEKVITSSVSNSYPRHWDEDFISRTWMSDIRRKFSNTVVIDYPKKLSDEASSDKIEINKNKYNKLRFDNRN